jgi:hypothetical protein
MCVYITDKEVEVEAQRGDVQQLKRMLTYAGVCWRMLAYADVCWRMQVEAQKGDMQQLQRQLRASDEALAACQVLALLALLVQEYKH